VAVAPSLGGGGLLRSGAPGSPPPGLAAPGRPVREPRLRTPSAGAPSGLSVLPVSLWLARHGETVENAEGRILGRRDPPLSPAGIAQAEALARRLKDAGIAAVWASPLRRARETAEIVGRALGIEPVVLADLVESDRGDWEGRRVAELADESPDLHAAFIAGDSSFRFPGGESMAEQGARTRSALAAVRAGPLPALVVAHAGTIRAALADSGAPVPPESALAHGGVVELTL
jgi:broad specificity phosphatase PhoE